MDIFKWFLELPSAFSDIGEWLTTELFTIGGYDVTLFAVFTTTILGIIIGAKIVALVIPN